MEIWNDYPMHLWKCISITMFFSLLLLKMWWSIQLMTCILKRHHYESHKKIVVLYYETSHFVYYLYCFSCLALQNCKNVSTQSETEQTKVRWTELWAWDITPNIVNVSTWQEGTQFWTTSLIHTRHFDCVNLKIWNVKLNRCSFGVWLIILQK